MFGMIRQVPVRLRNLERRPLSRQHRILRRPIPIASGSARKSCGRYSGPTGHGEGYRTTRPVPHFSTETVLVAARLRCTQRAAAETNDHRDVTGLFCTTCSPRRPCKQRMATRRPAIYGGRYQLADSRLLEDHRALSGCASELRRLGHAADGRGGGQRILRHTDVERRHGPITSR